MTSRARELSSSIELVEIWMESIHERRTQVSVTLDALIEYFRGQTQLFDYLKSQELTELHLGKDSQEVEAQIADHKNRLEVFNTKKETMQIPAEDAQIQDFETMLHLRIRVLCQALTLHKLLESAVQDLQIVQTQQIQDESQATRLISQLDDSMTKIEGLFNDLKAESTSIPKVDDGPLKESIKDFRQRYSSLKEDLNARRQSLQRHSTSLKNFHAKVEEISQWLANFRTTLLNDCKTGQTIGQANSYLARTKERLYALQRKAYELEGMQGAFKIIAPEGGECQSTESVTKEIFQLSQIVNLRIDLTSSLTKFLKMAEDVFTEMNELSTWLKSNANAGQLESKRQNIQQLYLQVCTLSKNCGHQWEDKKGLALMDPEDFCSAVQNVMEKINR